MGCVTSRDVQAPVPLQLQQATGVKGSPAEKRVHPKSASAPLKTKKGSGPVLLSSPTDIRTSTDFQIPAGGGFPELSSRRCLKSISLFVPSLLEPHSPGIGKALLDTILLGHPVERSRIVFRWLQVMRKTTVRLPSVGSALRVDSRYFQSFVPAELAKGGPRWLTPSVR